MKGLTWESKSNLLLNGVSTDKNNKRAQHDFYATNPNSVKIFLDKINQDNIVIHKIIHEPACGQGHISKELEKNGYTVISYDLYDHGYGKPGIDFLQSTDKADCFLTNPPYKHALEFAKKSIENLNPCGLNIMYLKIQFLEGKARNKLFRKYPPKYIYVNSSRQHCGKNGVFKNNQNLLCFSWFIWEKGFFGDTILRWID